MAEAQGLVSGVGSLGDRLVWFEILCWCLAEAHALVSGVGYLGGGVGLVLIVVSSSGLISESLFMIDKNFCFSIDRFVC